MWTRRFPRRRRLRGNGNVDGDSFLCCFNVAPFWFILLYGCYYCWLLAATILLLLDGGRGNQWTHILERGGKTRHQEQGKGQCRNKEHRKFIKLLVVTWITNGTWKELVDFYGYKAKRLELHCSLCGSYVRVLRHTPFGHYTHCRHPCHHPLILLLFQQWRKL